MVGPSGPRRTADPADPDIFAAINVCKFEFDINFAPEKFAFLSASLYFGKRGAY